MLLFLFLWRILIQSSFCERKLLSTQKPIFSEITFPDKQKWRHIFFIRPIHEWGWSLANILIAFWYWLESWVKKAMAPHASSLAWKIPWMEEPGRLQSMGSWRAGHDFIFTFMHWKRKWQPIPVLLPVESQGRQSLVGCRLWGCTESDTTEAT